MKYSSLLIKASIKSVVFVQGNWRAMLSSGDMDYPSCGIMCQHSHEKKVDFAEGIRFALIRVGERCPERIEISFQFSVFSSLFTKD